MSLTPFSGYSGSRTPQMLLIGEAWGAQEELARKPFVGQSGMELFRILSEAIPDVFPELLADALRMTRYELAWVKPRDEWLRQAGIGLSNVLNFRPIDNKLEYLCGTKKDVGPEYKLPSITKGKYLLPEHLPEVLRLREELSQLRPNLIVALGNTACWATLQATNISSIRGAVTTSQGAWKEIPENESGPMEEEENQIEASRDDLTFKVLPTYHPAGILRNWSWRPIVVADMMKAWRESAFPEIRRPARFILHNPSFADVEMFVAKMLNEWPPLIAWDTETAIGQIKCISFAWKRDQGITIPFFDLPVNGTPCSYWPTAEIECQVWNQLERIFLSGIPMLAQNGIYDLQYIMRLGIMPRNQIEDTMLLHHALFPELQKSLGFMGSIYTSESSWKLMRKKKPDTEKRDE